MILLSTLIKIILLRQIRKNRNNIVIYSKALKFIDNLEYESLKGLLNNWHPEKAEHPESLFIIRKISLLHMFENIRFYEDMREEISALFKIALDNCKEDQLKLFILLFQRQYLNIFTFQSDDIYKEQIKSLQELVVALENISI